VSAAPRHLPGDRENPQKAVRSFSVDKTTLYRHLRKLVGEPA